MKFVLECVDCGRQYETAEIMYLCPECASLNNGNNPPRGVLKTLYNYDAIKAKYAGADIFENLAETGFIDLLPLVSLRSLSYLKVGNTHLYRKDIGDHELYLKDDSQNPTSS